MNNPHPFTLRQLQYAAAVAQTGGFHKAAASCHVSQPSLSAQLAQLEGALEVRLFERSRRGVIVTAAGAKLLERTRTLLQEADDLVTAARQLKDPFAGRLRIGVIPTLAPYLLPEIAPSLRKKYPQLSILWSEEKTGVLLEQLGTGALDAVLLARVPRMEAFDDELIAIDRFVLAGAPTHPLLKRRRPAEASELDGQRVLLLEEGHCFRDQALALCATAHAREGDFRATSLSTLAQLASGGEGVTLLPELSLAVENRHGALAVRSLVPAPSRTIVLAWRKQSPLGPQLRQLGAAMRVAAKR